MFAPKFIMVLKKIDVFPKKKISLEFKNQFQLIFFFELIFFFRKKLKFLKNHYEFNSKLHRVPLDQERTSKFFYGDGFSKTQSLPCRLQCFKKINRVLRRKNWITITHTLRW